jgi:hypothetical protein
MKLCLTNQVKLHNQVTGRNNQKNHVNWQGSFLVLFVLCTLVQRWFYLFTVRNNLVVLKFLPKTWRSCLLSGHGQRDLQIQMSMAILVKNQGELGGGKKGRKHKKPGSRQHCGQGDIFYLFCYCSLFSLCQLIHSWWRDPAWTAFSLVPLHGGWREGGEEAWERRRGRSLG